jgi:hypothetical protein
MNSNNTDYYINPIYIQYKCIENHFLEYIGSELVYEDLKCSKCKINRKYSIRWKCKYCDKIYCGVCFPITNYYKCPRNHTYKKKYFDPILYKNSPLVCDICLKESFPKGNHLVDEECSLCFCLDCIKDENSFCNKIQED